MATGLSSGEGQPGAPVTVSGDRFDAGARVLFGATVVTAQVSGTAATFVVPDGLADGAYSVTVENPDGQFAKLTGAFHVVGSTASPSDGTSPLPPSTGGSATLRPGLRAPSWTAAAAAAALAAPWRPRPTIGARPPGWCSCWWRWAA